MIIEKELIWSAQRGEHNAQKKIYQRTLPYLRGIIIRYLQNTGEIDDVLQETFVKIFNKIGTYDSERGTFKNWITRIAVNESIMALRRNKRRATEALSLDVHDIAVLPTIVDQLSDDHLLQILQRMPTEYYKVFNLAIIEGYHHEEIAALLEISEAASRKRLSRARAWVRKTFRNTMWVSTSYFKMLSN